MGMTQNTVPVTNPIPVTAFGPLNTGIANVVEAEPLVEAVVEAVAAPIAPIDPVVEDEPVVEPVPPRKRRGRKPKANGQATDSR